MGKDQFGNDVPRCSFCGRAANEPGIGQLISSPLGASICSDCVKTCEELLNPERKKGDSSRDGQKKDPVAALKVPKPAEIKAELDKFVVGQEDAKKILSVAVHNHYKTSGAEAARMLVGFMTGEGSVPRKVKMGYEVVTRNSTR